MGNRQRTVLEEFEHQRIISAYELSKVIRAKVSDRRARHQEAEADRRARRGAQRQPEPEQPEAQWGLL